VTGEERIDEFRFIGELLRPLARDPAARNLADDTAVLTLPADTDLVVTKDLMAAGRHYFPDDDPALVARKLLRVNLSDLAAAGAEPVGFLLGIAQARSLTRTRLARFVAGLQEDDAAFGIPLLGGDTISHAGCEVFSLTALGRVPRGEALSRAGARAGDRLYLTGTIGDAALGLLARRGEIASEPLWEARRSLPTPRLAFACAARSLIHAAIDISDGLVADAHHMAEASGCRLEIDLDALPLSAPTRSCLDARPDLFVTVLTSGDDYELLIAASSDSEDQLTAIAQRTATPLARIGTVAAGCGVEIQGLEARGLHLSHTGFTH